MDLKSTLTAFAFKKTKHKFASPFRCRSGHKLTQIQKLGKIRDNSILINTICAN